MDVHPIDTNRHIVDSVIDQPIYQYSENNGPIYTGFHRQVQYNFSGWHVNPLSGDDVPAIFTGVAALVTEFIPVVGPVVSGFLTAFTGGTIANNALSLDYSLAVNFVDMSQYFNAPPGPCYTIPGGHCSSPKLPVRSHKEFIK